MAKTGVSQLDFLAQGRRGLPQRLQRIEQKQRTGVVRAQGATISTNETDARFNQFQNASFEQFNKAATVPLLWTVVGTVALNTAAVEADGATTVNLTNGGAV